MWQQEALVVTAAAEPEAGRDEEQLRQPTGLGGRVRGEPGGAPQEPRRQCLQQVLRNDGECNRAKKECKQLPTLRQHLLDCISGEQLEVFQIP
ncbi:hypothetical protein GW7_04592 [Heterocephalus glaber]|uniref:Uncharacterized protein n=1 Tax=Heterocephalus glaber TaxID=10181 RepID=G5BQ57_HETGA|nr:hypothetical protein GW7_04592 [Heterocephalus glaber]